jgi:hypothetical protein
VGSAARRRQQLDEHSDDLLFVRGRLKRLYVPACVDTSASCSGVCTFASEGILVPAATEQLLLEEAGFALACLPSLVPSSGKRLSPL